MRTTFRHLRPFTLLAALSALCLLRPAVSADAAAVGWEARPSRMPRTSADWAGRPTFVAGQVLVALNSGGRLADLSPAPQVLGYDSDIQVYRLGVPSGQEEALAAAWGRLPGVAFAEVNRIRHAFSLIPGDPLYASEQWNLRRINAPDGWPISKGSPNDVIAFVDTGIDLSHPDLAAKILPGINLVNPNRSVQDFDGHGTHCAGLAAAITNNGIGIAGVDWHARILPVKVLDPSGGGDDATIAQGIEWAADHGAKVINLSLGGAGDSSTSERGLSYARNKNVVVVASAGNDYMNGDPVDFPAASPSVIAVGALDDNDNRASYSETGSYISVMAPGGDPVDDYDNNYNHWITSTYPQQFGSYEQLAGTSEAAPQVSGLASLILSVNPSLTPDQVRGVIQDSAAHLGSPGRNDEFGYGRIDVAAALRATEATVAPAQVLLGDLNGDGKVTVADATLALNLAVGIGTASAAELLAAGETASPSGTGTITVAEVVRILRWALGVDPPAYAPAVAAQAPSVTSAM